MCFQMPGFSYAEGPRSSWAVGDQMGLDTRDALAWSHTAARLDPDPAQLVLFIFWSTSDQPWALARKLELSVWAGPDSRPFSAWAGERAAGPPGSQGWPVARELMVSQSCRDRLFWGPSGKIQLRDLGAGPGPGLVGTAGVRWERWEEGHGALAASRGGGWGLQAQLCLPVAGKQKGRLDAGLGPETERALLPRP